MGKVFDVIKGETKQSLDINDYIVKHPASTFFMAMEGSGPEGSDIEVGDVLVVDRAAAVKPGSLIVVEQEGELKLIRFSSGKTTSADAVLWGVVIGLVRKF